MEKRTAHYKLARVRELLASGHMRMTRAAFDSASGMGLNSHIVRDLLLQLDPRDFYKSMTTYEDHRVWQDVYIPITRYGALYVKLTVIEHVLVVSFKCR
jgi:motility quorum-sensing regulator/GCU-specific mRNA interferase toxin